MAKRQINKYDLVNLLVESMREAQKISKSTRAYSNSYILFVYKYLYKYALKPN